MAGAIASRRNDKSFSREWRIPAPKLLKQRYSKRDQRDQ